MEFRHASFVHRLVRLSRIFVQVMVFVPGVLSNVENRDLTALTTLCYCVKQSENRGRKGEKW